MATMSKQPRLKKKAYEAELVLLQAELVKMQEWVRREGERIVLVFEGRDAAGKGSTIKRVTQYLNPRQARVVALPAPTERQRTRWYFQRYVEHLPSAGEIVIFDRSWYNRAGVERVMGFSTSAEQEIFLREAPTFEAMLVESGVKLVKYWLDISKKEQGERLDARRSDPLRQLKVSPLDAEAQKKWDAYSKARDEMLLRTDSAAAPWWCVATDKKKRARLNLMRHLLGQLGCPKIEAPEPDILFRFESEALKDGRLAS